MTFLTTQKIIYATFCITFTAPAWTTTTVDFTLSSSRLADKPFIFQAVSSNQAWSGSLVKKDLSQQADGTVLLAKTADWDAGKLLTDQQAPTSRTIATYNYLNKQTIAFELSQLPDEIQTLFNLIPGTQITDDLGKQRVDYLRGSRDMESEHANQTGPHFKVRERVLGNIVHSTPVYAGAPTKHIVDADYSSFYEQHKTRPGTVYVGANDGMLHAFSADSGAELFAYIPSPLLKKLPQLTALNSQHEITMDGNSHVAEARVAGQWKTVLAAGMGNVAKGVFALDVSRPDQFMQGARALFEFTDNDDPDIGYITSPPFIAKIKTGSSKSGKNNYDYFVAIQSGQHKIDIQNSHQTEPFLFLLSLNKSPTTPWSKNGNYYKISINSNNGSVPNTLSRPVFILDKQRAIRYGYAGDTQGNLWRFDYTGDSPAAIAPKIIFSAKDNANNPQPITAQPVVSLAPDGGYLVLFGTGNAKEKPNNQNSFYAIHDSTKNNKEDYFITGRSQLARRELVPTTTDGKTGYKLIGKDFTYAASASNKKGWYLDYQQNQSDKADCKEQSVSEATLGYGTIFFNTIIPSGPACNQAGPGISYRLNAITGQSDTTNLPNAISTETAIMGAPILITAHTLLGNRDSFGRRYNTQHYSVLNFGTDRVDDQNKVIKTNKAILEAGRLSWREISNWQDLKLEH